MKGKDYMARVAQLPCVLCDELGVGPSKAEVHHIRTGQGTGERASDFLTIPLCPDCHRGPNGIHGDRSLLRIIKAEELDLLAITISKVIR